MASYNLMKKADRDRMHEDRKAELDAILDGTWPRNLDDQMRWTAPRGTDTIDWAKRMCLGDMAYLDNLEQRIAAGAEGLEGYEA